MDNKHAYGKGGRVKEAPDPTMINSAYKHDCSYADHLMPYLHKADLAYTLMLLKQGLIPEDGGRNLINGLLEIEQIPHETYIDYAFGDIYNSKEVKMKSLIGKDSGWLHIGRPRREAINIAFLLCCRSKSIVLLEEISSLAKSINRKALEHRETIVSDYTYLQQSTPTTFGHYIMTYLFPLLRDADRLKAYINRLNNCPAGSGVSNGSNLNLDREYVAELLGFDGVITHSRDAMWQSDLPVEIMNIIAMLFANMNRLTDELQYFTSLEFSIVDFPDRFARTSVIMPNKKNPYPLAYWRGLTNHFTGRLVSVLSCSKVFSGNPDNRIFIYNDIPDSLDLAIEAIRMLSAVIDSMTVNEEKALEQLSKGYTYASELSEYLTVTHRFDYSTAHKIVGQLVAGLINQEYEVLSDAVIEQITKEKTGTDIKSDIAYHIDFRKIVFNRKTSGSSSPSSVEAMNRLAEKEINITDQFITDKKATARVEKLDAALKAFKA